MSGDPRPPADDAAGVAGVAGQTSVTVTWWWHVHVLVGGVGLAAALVLRQPWLVLAAAPSVLLVAAASSWRPGPGPRVDIGLEHPQLASGDATTATVTVASAVRVRCAVRVRLDGAVTTDVPLSRRVSVATRESVVLEVPLRAGRWGTATVGPVEVRWYAPGRLAAAHRVAGEGSIVRVLPRAPLAAGLPRPLATHAATGVTRSTASGAGTEFADLRPFAPGDRARDVSPHVSARRGRPWVVRRHPDRRTDVVLLLDAFAPDELDDVLAAARSLAAGYLRAGDRVGVTTMTGLLRWLSPDGGRRHEHRIASALVDARVSHTWVRPAVEHLPRRALPPGALVLGITPGTDGRLAEAAVVLRARGWDVAVLVVAPRPAPDDDVVARAAERLVRLERRTVEDRLVARGVPAVAWDPTTPVDVALVELLRWRRGRRSPAGARS